MEAIGVDRSYRCCDQLGGEDLRDGDSLRIAWPDGSETCEGISVEHHTRKMLEQSSSFDYVTTKAYVIRLIYGAQAKIYLRQAGIRAERNPLITQGSTNAG